MSFKKVRRPPRRLRLTSYQRALRDAEQRLEKATQERTDCMAKLDELGREIPYLLSIVQALTPPELADPPTPTPPMLQPGPSTSPVAAEVKMDQAAFLQRFMPRPGRLTTPVVPPQPPQPAPGSSPDPDEFLTADNDRGYEILS